MWARPLFWGEFLIPSARFFWARRELDSQVIEVRGVISKWDGTTNGIVSSLRALTCI